MRSGWTQGRTLRALTCRHEEQPAFPPTWRLSNSCATGDCGDVQ